jgi:hypothetical protein
MRLRHVFYTYDSVRKHLKKKVHHCICYLITDYTLSTKFLTVVCYTIILKMKETFVLSPCTFRPNLFSEPF